jgi:hypothetical protein
MRHSMYETRQAHENLKIRKEYDAKKHGDTTMLDARRLIAQH